MGIIIFIYIFVALCVFIIGTLFGSFLSLATYRIPRHEDIIATRSYCPTCKHRLNFFDLIPVFSYIFRGAKCKYCKQKISPRYFLLETINGIIFLIFYLCFGYTLKMAFIALIYVLIVLIIGSKIMKSKMTDDERKIVEEKINNKKEKKYTIKNNSVDTLSKKSGVFLSELIIALLLFITLMVTAFIMTRNTNSNMRENLIKSNANFIATQNIEYCIATDYDKLQSYTLQEKREDITYNIVANISNVADEDYSKEDILKKIEVKVTYMVNGKENDVVLNTLKGKV